MPPFKKYECPRCQANYELLVVARKHKIFSEKDLRAMKGDGFWKEWRNKLAPYKESKHLQDCPNVRDYWAYPIKGVYQDPAHMHRRKKT